MLSVRIHRLIRLAWPCACACALVQLACFDRLCKGTLYSAEMSLVADKEKHKLLLIRELSRPARDDEDKGEFYMEPYRPISPSRLIEREEEPVHHTHQRMAEDYPMVGDDELAASAG